MAALSGDYTGCTVLFYDTSGYQLGSSIITQYDKRSLRVIVRDVPHTLDAGSECRLFILSSPVPCDYQGRILKEGARKVVAMYLGKEHENRGAERYKVNYPALVENLICDGRAYPLHAPLAIKLINISKSGIRFNAPGYSLTDGDRIQIRVKLNENDKLWIVEVVNHTDRDAKESDYGCRLLVGK